VVSVDLPFVQTYRTDGWTALASSSSTATLDRHGEGWEAARDGLAGDQGWPLYLERFAEQ
jgi:hypothetical protein